MATARHLIGLLLLAGLAACAGYGGQRLEVGQADIGTVLRVMGTPALEWTENDGRRQLAYPRGPSGVHTYMVHIGPDGKLELIENVLTMEHFARIRKDMTTEDVARVLGPVAPVTGVSYFRARDELVWEWRYCDDWNQLSRFYVLFDGSALTVRSTMSLRDLDCEMADQGGCWCGR
jgi:hypothetical protein